MQRYVEVTLFAQLLAKGLKVKPEELESVLSFYEGVMNGQAFLPGVMDAFLASRGASVPAWTARATQQALREVAGWSVD